MFLFQSRSRSLLLGLLALCVFGLATEELLAQVSSAPMPRLEQLPLPPGGQAPSYRPVPTDAGHYLSVFWGLFVIGVFYLWTWTGKWIRDDSNGLKLRTDFWGIIALCGGLAGILSFLCSPNFFLSVMGISLGYGLPLGLYVAERNARVPESAKVLTPRHLRSVALKFASQLGLKLVSREAREATSGPPIRLIGKSRTERGGQDRSAAVENSKGYMAARELIYDGILRRATDIHLEPKEDEMSVRLRVDGVMHTGEPFDRPTGDAIVNIFKVLSAMDITEKRKPQDGSFRAEMEGRDIDFRAATAGTQLGEKMSIRVLDKHGSVKTLEALGLRKQLLEQISSVVAQPHGLFLSCGPTGAGKSTTLYASLNAIDRFENNIITVEDPVEYQMDNVTQIEINTKAGQTFAGSLRSILRQDPDVVMIGEIRDGETAKIACQAATTGHMVFSTVHANDTITALSRLVDLGVEPFLLGSSLSGIMGQRLVRKLCDECKQAYKPSAESLKQMGLPPEKVDKFYRPPEGDNTCPACSGLGYYGRVGVFELLVVSERMRDIVTKEKDRLDVAAIRAEARKNGMLYMKEEGLRLVVKGITSLEELLRVVK